MATKPRTIRRTRGASKASPLAPPEAGAAPPFPRELAADHLNQGPDDRASARVDDVEGAREGVVRGGEAAVIEGGAGPVDPH